MKITTKNNISEYSYLQKEDIQPALQFGIDGFVEASHENIYQILQMAETDIKQYLKLYNETFLRFQRQNKIVRKIRSLPTSTKQNKEDYSAKKIAIDSKLYQNQRKATLEFIQVLEMGKYFLSRFRALLTGNSIQTKITVKTSDGIYVVDEFDIKDCITPILSTFGGLTKNNPFSLAYHIDVQLLKEKGLLNINNEISGTIIYQEIWKQKIPYLVQYKGWAEKYAKSRLVFNSKDAEIYDLMNQMEKNAPSSTSGWLNVNRYAELRMSMGGGGGYRTSQLKAGDVGLIQDKMISEKQENVNIIRQQMIKENLEELLSIVKIPMSNNVLIKEKLKKMFTEKESNIDNDITKLVNKEAQQAIEKLFK